MEFATLDGSAPAFTPEPLTVPESPRLRSVEVVPSEGIVEVPSLDSMRNTNREGLSKLARALGLPSEGSRNTLLSRLTPLAGKSVSAKG